MYMYLIGKRYSMKKRKTVWSEYAKILEVAGDRPHCAIMEFVKNDSPKQFAKDVKVLKEIFRELYV